METYMNHQLNRNGLIRLRCNQPFSYALIEECTINSPRFDLSMLSKNDQGASLVIFGQHWTISGLASGQGRCASNLVYWSQASELSCSCRAFSQTMVHISWTIVRRLSFLAVCHCTWLIQRLLAGSACGAEAKKKWYSSSWQVISELRGITCRMGSHSVTCHPTQVNSPGSPRLSPARQAGTRFTCPRGMEGWVDLGDLLHTEMVYPPADGHPSKY